MLDLISCATTIGKHIILHWPLIKLLIVEQCFFLLGLSKGNARVEISASSFFRSATVCNSLINTHARRFYCGVMADGEEFMRWKISTILWTDTKRIQNVHTTFTVDPH